MHFRLTVGREKPRKAKSQRSIIIECVDDYPQTDPPNLMIGKCVVDGREITVEEIEFQIPVLFAFIRRKGGDARQVLLGLLPYYAKEIDDFAVQLAEKALAQEELVYAYELPF